MNSFKKSILYIAFSCCSLAASAQIAKSKITPVVGSICPNFLLQDINYYSKRNATIQDFRGKFLILDFFSTGCTACFASFPKIENLRKKFGDRVQFVLVGHEGKYIRQSYEKYKEKYNLNLPVVYDTILFRRFKITGVPRIVWIDQDGVVQAMTGSVTEDNVKSFIGSRKVLSDGYGGPQSSKLKFNETKPFLINGNGGADTSFTQRSLLGIWTIGMPVAGRNIDDYLRNDIPLQVLGWPLSSLYRLAYLGKISDWPISDTVYYGNYRFEPVLELTDSSLFQFDWETEPNKFCYSQILPREKRTSKNMMEVMQRDLENFFGFKVGIEIRKMPYLKLVASEEARIKLKTKGGKPYRSKSLGGVNFFNVPTSVLVEVIYYNAHLAENNLPLFDETGINGHIDIAFDAVMTDWIDIRAALQKQGLDLVTGYKDMNVLVIGEKPEYRKP